MKKWVVDRIEGDLAVCENEEKKTEVFPIRQFPKQIKEGDVVCREQDIFVIDQEETQKRKKRIEEKFEKLLRRDKK